VSREEQLRWEAQWARPAAICAFVAGALLLAHIILLQSGLNDRAQIEALPDFLLSIDADSGTFTASKVCQSLGSLLLAPVFVYLFRAANARGAGMPSWFLYLIVIGPVLYALGTMLGSLQQLDVAHDFADRGNEAVRGTRGDDLAEDMLRDNASAGVFALSFAGSVAVGFSYVMVPIRARRVGLLSPFMSILGIVAGALFVLQLVPLVPVVVQAFWLGAIGAIFLGNWPGGRGPAWRSGEAEPWPTSAQRRGLEPTPERTAEDEPQLDPAEAPEPAAAVERPSSRKRKRNRR